MATYLGLDIGSNSVGSAWVDAKSGEIVVGVSVFPAGVEEKNQERGAPKNQARRQKRAQRRSIRRRAQRKLQLRQALLDAGLLPREKAALDALFCRDPWILRREGLDRPLTPYEFGRTLVHLGQRRGALGIESDGEDDEGPMKAAIESTGRLMSERARTFGELMAIIRQEGCATTEKRYEDAIRNRWPSFKYHATRAMVWEEFNALWNRQKEYGGELGRLLSDDLRRTLDNADGDETWQRKGALFQQRRTFWNAGTLGRCDLEPTDHRCLIGDRHAQAFRVLETVNNIRIQTRDEPERPLNAEERAKVIAVLRRQKSAQTSTVRRALGTDKTSVKAFHALNIERDEKRALNTDSFYREVVLNVFGETAWNALDEKKRESVNRALLKFDTANARDAEELNKGAQAWWGLDADAAARLMEAWKTRQNTNKRVHFSRRALLNLLPYMEKGLSVTQARQSFAEDLSGTATPEQRARYAFTITDSVRNAIAAAIGSQRADALLRQRGLCKASRHFLAKHPASLPPPPMLANPVVRKTIHEVRRHVNAYLARFGRKPERIVIELAREAYQSARVRNEALIRNRAREAERRKIIADFGLTGLSSSQQRSAVDRVLLCRQQREVCPYTGNHITPHQAAAGTDCEVDHIIPRSRGGDSGLSNLLLVARGANRDKGNRTPREWLEPEGKFADVLQRLGHFEHSPRDDYFRKNDFRRKWENLNNVLTADMEKRWRESQLTSTAYAATQVADYLQGSLYRDGDPGTRRIFFTNGRYTAMLRRDWQLCEISDSNGAENDSEARARLTGKDRTDHRHHAVDAVVIALTGPKTIEQAATAYAWQEDQKALTGATPKRPPIPPPEPWKSVESLREAVMRPVFGEAYGNGGLVVSHRPVKRKLVGALHEETALGVVNEKEKLYAKRIRVEQLSGKRLGTAGDKPGKGGLGPVRDPALRQTLRDILTAAGVNPDTATKTDFVRLAKAGLMHMPSGVPIRCVKVIQRVEKPVKIEVAGVANRIYFPGNNHHIEIIEDENTGRWEGECVSTFDAAQRVHPPKGIQPLPLVNRKSGPGKRFVMSLAEGETIHARRQDKPELPAGYYVVVRLEKKRIYFQPHNDARPAKEQEVKKIRWGVSPANLRKLGPASGQRPYKVRVSPLGEIQRVAND